MDQPVSAGSRGLTHFLHGISDDLRQQHRNHLFVVDNEALHSAANQLVNQLSISGRAVLGPEDSQDVPTTTDLHGSWERVVMNQ
ncbi:unnamed protein product [Dicrocoelium dendriticum]|nr:unnamed protein product [Dicrocoelium dendriticum]